MSINCCQGHYTPESGAGWHWPGWPGLGTGQAEKCALDVRCDPELGLDWGH